MSELWRYVLAIAVWPGLLVAAPLDAIAPQMEEDVP